MPLQLHKVASLVRRQAGDLGGRRPTPDGSENVQLGEDIAWDEEGDVLVSNRSLETLVFFQEQLFHSPADVLELSEEVHVRLWDERVEILVASLELQGSLSHLLELFVQLAFPLIVLEVWGNTSPYRHV